MEGDDVYLDGVFLSSSLCLRLPNRLRSGYLAGTTAALENRYRFPKKKKKKEKCYCPIWFCLSFNQSKPDSHYLRGFTPGCTISCCGNYMFTDDYNAPIQSMTSVDCNANKTQSSFVILKVKALKKVKQVIRYSPQKAETRPRLAPQLSQ